MRKFLIFFLVCFFIILLIASFLGTLYIPETFNKQSLTLRERITCIFNPDQIQKASIEAYIIKRKSAVIVEQNENNLKLLDGDAHQYAMTEFCKKSGGKLTIEEDSGLMSCDYTQESCEQQTNLLTTTLDDGNTIYSGKSTFLEWHNGKCVKSYPAAKGICDLKFNFKYDKGDILCEGEKIDKCTVRRNPTCYISSDYCRSKGLEHESAGGFGDCYNPLWQELLESLVGTTLTRKFKGVVNDLINNCKNDPFSSDCAKAAAIAAYPQYTLSVIAKDTAFKFFPERWTELTETCGAVDGTSSEDIINCLLAYQKFDPVSYMVITFVKILGQLVCKNLESVDTTGITGFTCDIIGKTIKGLLIMGDKALEYLKKFPYAQIGKAIVESFSELGDILGDGFDQLKDGMVKMFDGLADFAESIPDIINTLGELNPVGVAAKAILLGGVDVAITFVELFDADKINDIVTYGATIADAFEIGGEELGKFVTSQLIEGGIDTLKNAGEIYVAAYGEAAEIFSKGLNATARELENAGDKLKDAGETIGNAAQDVGESLADAVVNGLGPIGGFFGGLF